MRKKNYKGAKVSKRVVAKCEGVCRTYDAIQYAYANLLSETEEVKSFQVNVLLQGLEEGAYTSDFVIIKADGNLMVRECVSRKHLTKPMTTKLLDASRNYWKSHGVSDWGKHSDAGQTIENDYYIFEATNKANGKKEIIQCGMTVARDFLKKINHEGLLLFNPLHGEGGTGKKGSKTSGGNESKEVKWNPIAKQLYNAIMWVIVIIDAKPNTAIYEVKEKVWKFKSYEPFPSQVKAVNTIIGKNIVGKTLTEAIDGLRHDNDIRDGMCDFDKLVDIIGNYKDKEGNPVVIVSKF